MKIYNIINYTHSIFSLYMIFGWTISDYHCKILLFLVPSSYLYYLLDDNYCFITRIENHFKDDDKKEISFIQTKLNNINIKLKQQLLDKIIYVVLFNTYIMSYYRIFF